MFVLLEVVGCVSSPCQNNGTCRDQDGSGLGSGKNMFECDCMSGYTGVVCESGDMLVVCNT